MMGNLYPDLSLVIACYNEETLLARSVREVVRVLDAMDLSYELIFVDDASQDNTRAVIQEVVKQYGDTRPIQVLFHEKNRGRGKTVQDGFEKARGAIVGYIDIDLEVAAHYILPCVLAFSQGFDAVVGKRIYKFRWDSLDRYVLSKGYAWLVRKMLKLDGLTDTESGYKFFKREKIESLLSQCQEDGWFWDTEIMALSCLSSLRIKELPCLMIRCRDKVSSLKPLRDSIDYFVRLLRFRSRLSQLRAKCVGCS